MERLRGRMCGAIYEVEAARRPRPFVRRGGLPSLSRSVDVPAERARAAELPGSAGACLIGHFQDIQGHLHSPVPVEGGRWREDIRERYEFLVRPLVKMAREGLGGSVYTEAIDQFWEGGGLVTFDRAIVKFDYDFLRAIHKEILDAARDGAAGR